MIVMYFILGNNLDFYVQAFFSILSFKKQLGDTDRIVVVTTNPELLSHLSFVECVVVDNDLVDKWKGQHNFFWRAKIKAIECVAKRYPNDNMVYLDSDTFLYGDFAAMKKLVAEGNGFMDGDEGHPSKIKFKPQRMYRAVSGHQYAGVTVGGNHNMWCAGVVAMPANKKFEIINMALAICDGMLDDGAEPIVVEQYAISIAMYEITKLLSAKEFVAHYWANKSQWIRIAKDLIVKSFFINASLNDELDLFSSLKLDATPIYLKKHNRNKILKKFVDKLLGDENPKYIGESLA